MRICFFGHPAHVWSGSSKFFEKIIEGLGEVTYSRPTTISVDSEIRSAIESNYDLYIFWQFDFLAYAFIAAGKRVVIAPMIDGSASYGREHWSLLKGARFISFSSTLHRYLKMQNMQTLNITYWPEPQEYVSPKSNSIYYWPRGHHSFVSTKKILEATRNYSELRLKIRTELTPQSNLDYSRVVSDRIELIEVRDQAQHLREIEESLVFVAPRPSEGIGHSFLEAMSMGRTILARNFPTMSDYLVNHRSGVFFPRNNTSIPLGLDMIKIGKQAHQDLTLGRENFLASIPALQQHILGTKPKRNSVRVREIHSLIDRSCQVMRGQYFPRGNLTLQDFSRFQVLLNYSRPKSS